MPRKQRLRRREHGWNDEHRRILRTGRDYFSEFRDLIDMHAAWQELRQEIMDQWIVERPGTRPFAWWAFDMPPGSRRECVTGQHPYDDPNNDTQRKLWYGKPQRLRPCDLKLEYETEAQFLVRLNLCSAAELMALEKGS